MPSSPNAIALHRHGAHYVFPVKANQKTLMEDIELFFRDRNPQQPDSRQTSAKPDHRFETRAIWTTTALSHYLKCRTGCIERRRTEVKTGKQEGEVVYGVTSHTPDTADARQILAFNRGHWTIENACHYILDTCWREDHACIRTGYGPEYHPSAALRDRPHQGPRPGVKPTTERLHRNIRAVFDYLKMTGNTRTRTAATA